MSLTCSVVPHAGTWIEIPDVIKNFFHISSFPTRERGLKSPVIATDIPAFPVVPHAGTWIEISVIPIVYVDGRSFPTRERGLKLS